MRIWLARLDQSQMRYPAKLEAQTGFGTIRGRILSFRERRRKARRCGSSTTLSCPPLGGEAR